MLDAFSTRSAAVATTARHFLRKFKEHDLGGLAAELAYRFFLALFPFVLFLAALGGLLANVAGVANPADRVIELFGDTLPADAQSVLRDQVDGVVKGGHASFISISIVLAIWASSSGVAALIKAIHRVCDTVESRPFWKKTAIALGVTFGGGLALIAIISAVVASEVYASDIARLLGLGPGYRVAVQIVRIPILLSVVLGTVLLVYRLAPDAHTTFRGVFPGAALFTILWAGFTAGFAFYVSTFGSYTATYGVLAGVVVLLLWFYVSSLLLVSGAEFNAVLGLRRKGAVATAEERTERAWPGDTARV